MKTLKYALRFLMRSKSYTLINLLGLAFSLACCIILMRYIHRELTVDTHCIDRNTIYGICTEMDGNRSLSGIEQYSYDTVRIDRHYITRMTKYIPLEKEYVMNGSHRYPARCLVTDSVYFQLFRYPLLQGNLRLESPESAIITETFAHRIFGKENPIGKILRSSNGKDIRVDGVIGMPDCKATIQFDVVLSWSLSTHWSRMYSELYQFLPGTNLNLINELGSKPRYCNPPEWDNRQYTFQLIPFSKLYWQPELTNSEPTMFLYGDKGQLHIFIGACALLFIAGLLNFINIYFVVMMRRGKEYGLKKVLGAKGKHLFISIWLENTLLVGSSLLVAWLIIELTAFPVAHVFHFRFVYTAFDVWLSIGLLVTLPPLTSLYPFWNYHHSSPIRSIRSVHLGNRSVRIRMYFLGIQYILTFLLTVLSFYFNRQLNTLLTAEPGFRTENILTVNLAYESKDDEAYRNPEAREARINRLRTLDTELKACPLIEHFIACDRNIIDPSFNLEFRTEQDKHATLNCRYTTPEYFKLYDLDIVEGELPSSSSEETNGRQADCFIINQAAKRALGYTSIDSALIAIGTKDNSPLRPVVAVVTDYYEGHLTAGIVPTVYMVQNRFNGDYYQISYQSGKRKEILQFLSDLEERVYGSRDFEYTLLKDEVDAFYEVDRQTATIYSVFATIAIIISALGLFGISLFDIRQRYREIAIRKVNGAGFKELYLLLLRKYIIVLTGAFAIAIPLSYYLIDLYTRDFAVKAPVGTSIFIISLLLVMIISLGTLIWQIRKAAHINPAKIIKTE